jgi:hypothetical protein|uniref:Uncharacterized protein n=1 Tax=Zea mays TaxID=4577 RepID=B4FC06_MAIZE|nr:unknown [Zea mays]
MARRPHVRIASHVRVAVDDLHLLDVAAVAAGHLVHGAAALDGAADGGAAALQRRAVRGDGDRDALARLRVGGQVEGAAVDADVELHLGGVGRAQAPRPPAHGELGVAARVQRVGAREQRRAVGQRLQRQRHVVAAQVLHRHLLVLHAVVVRQVRARQRQHGRRRQEEQGRRRGLR